MKVAESGMPDEKLWETFFRPEDILRKMGLSEKVKDVVDFGCGYGTFTLPAAKIVSGVVYAVDIEEEMVESIKDKSKKSGLQNIKALRKDIESEGTGLKDESVDYVLLFNILHGENPKKILREAYRIIKPGGRIGIIHWKYDSTTPRGPPMELRLRPEKIIEFGEDLGFKLEKKLDLKPYHYGLVVEK